MLIPEEVAEQLRYCLQEMSEIPFSQIARAEVNTIDKTKVDIVTTRGQIFSLQVTIKELN